MFELLCGQVQVEEPAAVPVLSAPFRGCRPKEGRPARREMICTDDDVPIRLSTT